MRFLTLGDFEGRRGQTYEIIAGGGRLPVVLGEVQPLPGSQRQGGGFRLIFQGPPQPILPQGVFPIRHGDETHEIFIVPIAQVQAGIQYEALFL
jgi:hypothetical protein